VTAGAAVLRREFVDRANYGYELPPLMFTEDEAEGIAVGVRLLARTGDPGLQKAAESVLSKMTLVVPDPLCDY
jgi:predicted DNA-binding transcriptional regulator YafY